MVPPYDKYTSLCSVILSCSICSGLFHKKGAVAAARTRKWHKIQKWNRQVPNFKLSGNYSIRLWPCAAEKLIKQIFESGLVYKIFIIISVCIRTSASILSEDKIHWIGNYPYVWYSSSPILSLFLRKSVRV
jgi:hypothetical protein